MKSGRVFLKETKKLFVLSQKTFVFCSYGMFLVHFEKKVLSISISSPYVTTKKEKPNIINIFDPCWFNWVSGEVLKLFYFSLIRSSCSCSTCKRTSLIVFWKVFLLLFRFRFKTWLNAHFLIYFCSCNSSVTRHNLESSLYITHSELRFEKVCVTFILL